MARRVRIEVQDDEVLPPAIEDQRPLIIQPRSLAKDTLLLLLGARDVPEPPWTPEEIHATD